MPPHEDCKGGFVLPAEEGLQQLSIGQPRPVPQKHGSAKLAYYRVHQAGRHVVWSVAGLVGPLLVFAPPRPISSAFFVGLARLEPKNAPRPADFSRQHGPSKPKILWGTGLP